jgi:hypothetical protein
MIRKIVDENDSRLEHEKWKWSDISEILKERIEGCVRSGKQCRERYPIINITDGSTTSTPPSS